MIEYRFSDFTLSPQRRILLRDGREVPLIPRYFDLLLLLVERRREAVHRREIFDRVWADGIVSDSALTQAIRTIRRTLGDEDPREPRFIRTVSRHGYQFVFPDVHEHQEPSSSTEPARVVEENRVTALDPPPPVAPAYEGIAPAPGAGRLASGGAAGGALAGAWAGAVGGLILTAAPGSTAPIALAPVLAVIGGGCGALGGVGVGTTLGVAEAAAPSPRTLALTGAGALGGGLVGTAVQWLTRWGLAALVGIDLPVGGGIEGVLLGGVAGLGYALTTTGDHDQSRAARPVLHIAAVIALLCGAAALALALTGRPLAGGTIHLIADAAEGSRATLAPLGRLLGEPDLGPVTRALLAFGEGATFGFGFGWGVARRRPRG